MTIIAVNDPPDGVAQSVTTLEDMPKAITLTGSDADGGALTSYAVTTPPTHGTLSGTAPNLTYTPEPDYNGPDSFVFTVRDGTATGEPATVSITVTAVNDAPVAATDQATVAEDSGATSIAVLANDTAGPDVGETLTVTAVTPASHGSVTFTATDVSYTPNANFFGTDTFTYTLNDGTPGEQRRLDRHRDGDGRERSAGGHPRRRLYAGRGFRGGGLARGVG